MSRFEHELRKRITEEIGRLTVELAMGMAVKDYAQYQNYVGKLQALTAVLDEYFDEVNKKLSEG